MIALRQCLRLPRGSRRWFRWFALRPRRGALGQGWRGLLRGRWGWTLCSASSGACLHRAEVEEACNTIFQPLPQHPQYPYWVRASHAPVAPVAPFGCLAPMPLTMVMGVRSLQWQCPLCIYQHPAPCSGNGGVTAVGSVPPPAPTNPMPLLAPLGLLFQ